MDSFLSQRKLVIVLEWADAGDLKRQIRLAREQGKRFEERLIWRYTSQIAGAVRHMHEHRIIHRDLKPANIFVTSKGVIKVGDLGLSRFMSESTLEAFSKVGTPLYMAPEVLKGHGYDFKSDIWSLGCILYELAMLRSPFKEKGIALMDLFRKIDKAVFPPVPKTLSRRIAALTRAMISKDVSRRPSIKEICQVSREQCDAYVRSAKQRDEQALAVAASEDASFRLSLLAYEARYHKTFPPLYFVYPLSIQRSVRHSNQFDDFIDLCKWLASLLNLKFFPAPEMPEMQVATMLLNCSRLTFSDIDPELQTITPAQLRPGYGLSVCLLLCRLTEKALEAERFVLQIPCHPHVRAGTDIEDVWREDNLVQESSDEDKEEDKDDEEAVALLGGSRETDATLWRQEYCRIRRKLQATPDVIMTDDTAEWRRHLSFWKLHGEVLLTACPIATSSRRSNGLLRPSNGVRTFAEQSLSMMSSLSRSLKRLRRLERGLQGDFVEAVEEMTRVRQEIAHGRQRLLSLQATVALNLEQLSFMQDKLELQRDQKRSLQAGPQSMKDAIAELKAEIAAMNVETGVAMGKLFSS